MTTAAKEKYLEEKGWTRNPSAKSHWFNPRKTARQQLGGLNTDFAYEEQFEFERMQKGLPYYRVMRAFQDYGHVLVEFSPVKGKPGTMRRRHVWYSPDRDELVKAMETYHKQDTVVKFCKALLNDRTNYNRILVETEKHGSTYYQANSIEQLQRACLDIFKRHDSDDSYYDLKPGSSDSPRKPQFTAEQIAKMPDGGIKTMAKEQLEQYEHYQKHELPRVKRQQELYEIAKDKTKSERERGQAAAVLLFKRKDYEYERVEVVDVIAL